MEAERQFGRSSMGTSSVEFQTPSNGLLNLSPLQDRTNYYQTIEFLNRSKSKFHEAGWKGGVETENGRYTHDDVISLATDIYQGNISPQLVSANEKLALAQASQFAGADIPDKHLARLHERAQIEYKITQDLESAKSTKKRPSMKWVGRVVVPTVTLAVAFAASEAFQSPKTDSDIGAGNEPRVSEVGPLLDGAQPDTERQSGISGFFSQVGEKVESVVKKVPNVEDLESSIEKFDLWGFDLNDPENPLTISWDSPEIVALNNGEPLEFTVSPIENLVGNHLSTQCYSNSAMECSAAFDGFILIQAHSSLNNGKELAMESERNFLEGGVEVTRSEDEDGVKEERQVDLLTFLKPEERETRRLLLERRVPLTQGEHEAKAQVAVVRIEERYVWPKLYNDQSIMVEEALKIDPTLPERINLERPLAVFFTCGWRLPGDKLSHENVNWYSSSMYLFFVGEAPVS